MTVGFETIGNATLIAYDEGPVLVTDPWIQGGAYFGSWKLSHEVPPAQLEACRRARYAWFSHGHPDHLNADSLPQISDKQILLPDHVGGRIRRDLEGQGFSVRVLRDREWIQLSPQIRVLCIADYNQDAVLLIDINGRLVVNLNDASNRGWSKFVREVIQHYDKSFLLALHGFGDADMLNYFDESGRRLPLPDRAPLGQTIAAQCDYYGVRYFIPFSSMHRYQRTDSAWAAPVAASLDDYRKGFSSSTCTILPAFIRFDCERDEYTEIKPAETENRLYEPERFGDNWSDQLDVSDIREAEEYFLSIEKLHSATDFINLRIGGRDNYIHFKSHNFMRFRRDVRGLTFETPRTSLMAAIEYRVFDDLLIGNFTKVTVHGDWGPRRLYPDFTPYIAKYGDNGGARTKKELAAYFAQYRQRDPIGHLQHLLEVRCILPLQQSASNAIRGTLGPDSSFYRVAKKGYWLVRRGL